MLTASEGKPYHPDRKMNRWSMDKEPLWLDFNEPTISNLNPDQGLYPDHLDVVNHTTAKDAWIYLVVTAHPVSRNKNGIFPAAAHPIHLHGHDFALLHQSKANTTYPGSFDNITLKTQNPPRRDVVLLPEGGFIVIAFKADNPGAWLVHCHIAWHASSGLGFQIIENKHLIKINPESERAMNHTCVEWNKWWNNGTNHYNATHSDEFQDDSGI